MQCTPMRQGSMKINVGCGATPMNKSINYDNSLVVRLARSPLSVRTLSLTGVLSAPSREFAAIARLKTIDFANASVYIPWPDASVEALYSSHMVEHLDGREARAFLAEASRVLKPGGVIRLVVPDLARLVSTYTKTRNADECVRRTNLSQPRRAGFLARLHNALLGPRHHLWMYDGDSLSVLLGEAALEMLASCRREIPTLLIRVRSIWRSEPRKCLCGGDPVRCQAAWAIRPEHDESVSPPVSHECHGRHARLA